MVVIANIWYNVCMKYDFPISVKACLWSYDTDKIDLTLSDHKFLIVKSILNNGTTDAVNWLFNNFSKQEIASIIEQSNTSEWNKKSLSLWSLVFNINPLKKTRFA